MSIRMAKRNKEKNLIITSTGEDSEQLELSYIWEGKMIQTLGQIVC